MARLLSLGLALAVCSSAALAGAVEVGEARTLEDLFGDTGNTFQAAVGFINFEGTAANQAGQSYGLGIDDMVVKWREFTLTEDGTDCASGSCAAIEFGTTNVFDGNVSLRVRLVETSPPATNDCDLDGNDDGTNDCNGNGVPDLVVLVTSEAEVDGEIVHLDRETGSTHYLGSVTVSSLADVDPGVLFVAPFGSDLPTVTATYEDLDDGTGQICKNNVDPAKWGKVQSATTIFLGPTCDIAVVDAEITDNGDRDQFADSEETIEMRIEWVNNCGIELHDCSARIATNSPEVDCVLSSVIDLGDLPDDSEVRLSSEAFVWRVAELQTANPRSPSTVEFNVSITCNEIDAVTSPQSVQLTLDLDLDALGQTPSTWIEDFESGTLGAFVPENLDAGLPGNNNAEGLANSDGWRCQFSDPDWPNSGSYGSDQAQVCYPAYNLQHANNIFWQVDGATVAESPDGGRAFSGNHSMYYGIFLTTPAGQFTTPMKTIESVATTDPINLGVDGSSILTFWHQISLIDDRALGAVPALRSADRGVVHLQIAGEDGAPAGHWIRLEPYQNTYDEQAVDNYFNCKFDPIDDGNTEDDFFDPEDPNRRLGPSSTCYPAYNWSYLGDTDGPFLADIGNATTPPGPGDAPDLGVGTWVESSVSLEQYRGQRVRFRYLVSAAAGSQETWELQFGINPDPRDDGWWIDTVQVTETLAQPAVLTVDQSTVRSCLGDPLIGCVTNQHCVDAGTSGPCSGPAPSCGVTCNAVALQVETNPDTDADPLGETLPAPGQTIRLDASSSFADRCVDGVLLFRFLVDGSEARGWSPDPIFVATPQQDLIVEAQARCSSDTACADTAVVDIGVDCPSAGPGPLFQEILASTTSSWTWTVPTDFDVFRGDSAGGFYAGDISISGSGTGFSDPGEPSAGEFDWYVVRVGAEYCNETGAWSSGGSAEDTQREVSLP